ncbi:MAG: ABC transporter permease [Lachnospiraceae bacterium]|nr:ABC transporter permease [Lachnospiraceae bacterium]
MGNLVKAEWFKLAKSLGYKILITCCICTGILFSVIAATGDQKLSAYDVLTSCIDMLIVHSIFGNTFAAVFIGSEFKNHTFGNSLLNGQPRQKLFLAKIIVFFAGFFLMLFITWLVTVVIVSYYNGFGMDFSLGTCKNILLLFLYVLTGYMAFGAVIILMFTIIRKEAVTVAAGILFTYVYLFARTNLQGIYFLRYTFFYQIELMAFSINKKYNFGGDVFSGGLYFAVTILTFITALVLSVWCFKRMELK